MSDELYVCVDDEGNKFLYQGQDTFIKMSDGPEKKRWMQKLIENKVKIHPIAGMVLLHPNGEQELKLFDEWEKLDAQS